MSVITIDDEKIGVLCGEHFGLRLKCIKLYN